MICDNKWLCFDKTLVKNNYPKKLINSTIKETIDKIEGRTESKTENSGQGLDHKKIITIPYINEVNQKIKHMLNKYDFKTVYKKGTSIKSMLTRFKHIDSLESHDLVYNISCYDCDANYWGNTKRKLEIRVKEHKSALNKPYVHSNIAEHSFATKHDINWKNPKIIYHQPNKKARFFLENWDIEKSKTRGLPIMNEMHNNETGIPRQYLPLLNR